jgi:hypothetical protein
MASHHHFLRYVWKYRQHEVSEGGGLGVRELAKLIASLQEWIAQQNSIIASQNRVIEYI